MILRSGFDRPFLDFIVVGEGKLPRDYIIGDAFWSNIRKPPVVYDIVVLVSFDAFEHRNSVVLEQRNDLRILLYTVHKLLTLRNLFESEVVVLMVPHKVC